MKRHLQTHCTNTMHTPTSLSYSMNEAVAKTNLGTRHIVRYLSSRTDTVGLHNVEGDPDYRTKDIDLLWHRQKDGHEKMVPIEVKVDTYFQTGNYFLETISNVEKNTPGCFMYSQAEFFFYYFLEKELHVLHLDTVRDWFKSEIDNFKPKRTSTPVGDGFYQTEGRLVNRDLLRKALPRQAVVVIQYDPAWAF
jgi:hypothetical protein